MTQNLRAPLVLDDVATERWTTASLASTGPEGLPGKPIN